jgi:hypothetical protein
MQTRPLVRESAPQKQDRKFQTATFRQEVISGGKCHKGARYQDILPDWLTVSRKVTSTSMFGYVTLFDVVRMITEFL